MDIEEVRTDATVDALKFKELVIRMRKSDVAVRTCDLVWLPYGVSTDGIARPLYEA